MVRLSSKTKQKPTPTNQKARRQKKTEGMQHVYIFYIEKIHMLIRFYRDLAAVLHKFLSYSITSSHTSLTLSLTSVIFIVPEGKD